MIYFYESLVPSQTFCDQKQMADLFCFIAAWIYAHSGII